MSTAPRPQTQPSSISPENGSTCQSGACAGTTSRWPWMSRPGRVWSSPCDPGDHAGPALVRLEDGRLDADVGEEGGDVFCCLALAGAGVVAPVGRVDPDQVAARPATSSWRGLPGVAGVAGFCVINPWSHPLAARWRPVPGAVALLTPVRGRCRADRRCRCGGGGRVPGVRVWWPGAGRCCGWYRAGTVRQAVRQEHRLSSPERAGFAIVRRPVRWIPWPGARPGGGIGRRASLRC